MRDRVRVDVSAFGGRFLDTVIGSAVCSDRVVDECSRREVCFGRCPGSSDNTGNGVCVSSFGVCRSGEDTGNGVCDGCLARVRLWGVSGLTTVVVAALSCGSALRSGKYCSRSNGGGGFL
jgi:hypothetical protein